jgi:hypothetical protein
MACRRLQMDPKEAARILGALGGKIGGRSRSLAKIRAARMNGSKGGRPRKDKKPQSVA